VDFDDPTSMLPLHLFVPQKSRRISSGEKTTIQNMAAVLSFEKKNGKSCKKQIMLKSIPFSSTFFLKSWRKKNWI